MRRIPEEKEAALQWKAREKLEQYKRIYRVEGGDEWEALDRMVEVLYNAELVANNGIQSASIGSVSTTYGDAAAKAVDVTPAGIERALLEAAKLYLDIYTGVDG